MAGLACRRRRLFVLVLGSLLLAGRARGHRCPVRSCRGGGAAAASAAALLQTDRTSSGSGGSGAPSLGDAGGALESEKPCQEVSSYDIDYSPGHFTCSKCDATSCPDCSVLCDVSSCVGEFYTNECWCDSGGGGPGQPKSESVTAFCDANCDGGVCSTPGYSCRPRTVACQPWWWCGAAPPTSFLQRLRARRVSSSAAAKAATATERRQNTMLQQARLESARSEQGLRLREQRRLRALAGVALPAELGSLSFKESRFICESGALPPKTKNPATLLWVERGYLVLDKRSCEGSEFVHTCYCWDSYKYQKGLDPLTSRFQCDPDCRWGVCEGRTCSHKLPPPLPRFFAAATRYLPGQLRTDTTMDVSMDSIDDLVDSKSDASDNGTTAEG